MKPPASPISETVQRPLRDIRLDIVRGWLQLTILASHVGGFASMWLIHAAWGYSDSSEQFVLLSGLMLGSVFTLKRLRDGWRAAARDMALRAARLWRTRLVTLLAFGAMMIALDQTVLQGEATLYHFDFLMRAPLRAAAAAAALLYNPAYIDVLVVFLVGMIALPAFVFAIERIGAWALLLPAGLWGAVLIWHLPSPDLAENSPTAFNLLAWQFLFMLGAYVGRRKLLTGRALPDGHWPTWLAGAIVLLGIALRIVEYADLNFGFHPPVIDGVDKLELSPLRLLHALALAVFVARITPMRAEWMERWPATTLASIGRHSLNVYCVGIFLSFGAARLLEYAGPRNGWLEAPLIVAGFALLGLYARWQDGARWRLQFFNFTIQAQGETR
jgi:hypothetical protein